MASYFRSNLKGITMNFYVSYQFLAGNQSVGLFAGSSMSAHSRSPAARSQFDCSFERIFDMSY
jgi:hypothetical protein